MVGLVTAVEPGESEGEGVSLGIGKAKVGETTGVGDPAGDGLKDGLGVGVGVSVGVGVGMMFVQRYSSLLAPPSSSTSF